MKGKAIKAMLLAAVVAIMAAQAGADGMIIPVRPEHRVSGTWAVKYHKVSMTVRDQVLNVSVDQEFVNTGGAAMEVEYLFPIPPHAAIDAMRLLVNGKEFEGRLMKAEEARTVYESIVRTKKDPALLEYVGFGLYKTKAFPLEPNKPAHVVVNYKDIAKKTGDTVEVFYPLNTEKFSAKRIEQVEVSVDIKSEADLTAVYSPSHDLKVDRKDARHMIATYAAVNTLPVTDFQVFYKQGNEAVGATLLSHQAEPGKEGYFLMLVSPNPRSQDKAVLAKDVVVALDCSGSMSGEKIRQAKEALTYILRNLSRADRFNIVTYNDTVETFYKGMMPADEKTLKDAQERVDRLEARSGTNFHDALLAAMNLAGGRAASTAPADDKTDADRAASKRPAYIIVLTDGLPTQGKTDEGVILEDARKANDVRARLFAFGVGYDVNVRLLDKLVEDNHGRSEYVKPSQSIETPVSALYNKIKSPVMTGLKVEIANVGIKDAYPRELGDLFEGDQLVVAGRYSAEDAARLPKGEGKYRATLLIRGAYQGKEQSFEYPVSLNPPDKDSRFDFVEKLWAIRRIGWLMDQIALHGGGESGPNKEFVDEIVRLSKDYGIMTPYTSFLADERVALGDKDRLALHAGEKLGEGFGFTAGRRGAMQAEARQELKYKTNFAKEAAAHEPAGAAGQPAGMSGGAVQYGNADAGKFDKGEAERVAGIRNVGNQSLYQRGKLWIDPAAAHLDPEKDKDKIIQIERYTKEYFELVRQNNVQQNQLLATQQADEEIMIKLRGQVYRVR